MSVELPFAPVDDIIRRHAGDLRVSADAAEELARRIQNHGAAVAATAAERADEDGRKTLMAADFDVQNVADRESLALPVAPVDRIARLDIPDEYRVSEAARLALAARLEEYAADAASGAAVLAEHAGRRTVQAEDVETYFEIVG
ncbi:histone [Salarchaeum sp. JOR-1]|uniref:histone n=1 Tax=Salarchaeum sp. JOR-1 TaxID=2599399 RepID=UPI001198C778|nr:histone [Salarchaeum sp. JOR-1]QDX39905.1 aldolase [Salarchaeum sp. JOR-1]